jgi:hypothetical protein
MVPSQGCAFCNPECNFSYVRCIKFYSFAGGVKQPGREADHSPPSRGERGATPPIRKYVFMEWCLVKHSDKFTVAISVF